MKGIIVAIGLENYLTVDCLNKEKADFIAFIVNNQTVELVPEILKGLKYKPRECKKFFIKDVNRFSEGVQEFLNSFYWLTEIKKAGKIVVDATNTLKTIGVPVYFVASFIEVFKDFIGEKADIKRVFTTCEWEVIKSDSGISGRPILGTEGIIELEHPTNSIGFILCSIACSLFNQGFFPQAKKFFEILEKDTLGEQNLLHRGLTLLASAYDFWDKFSIKEAEEELKRAVYVLNKMNRLAFIDKMMKKLRTNLRVLGKLKKEIQTEKIIDVFENGNRKMQRGIFDDAVARYYRCLDMIAQYALAKYGIDTAEPDFSKLSPEVVKKYKKERGGALPEKYKEGVGGIALKNAFLLLYCLDDSLGQEYKKIETKFIGLLTARNQSILAHGLKSITEEKAEKFRDEMVKPFLKKLFEEENLNLEQTLKGHQYPKLSTNIKNLFLDLKKI